jgi:DNA sulfur modification protein DndC
MIELQQVPTRFVPSKDTLEVLNSRQWIASFSGGKDSTALLTWLEWLRRMGWVDAKFPMLVNADTTVEDAELASVARRLMDALTACGWHCEVITPGPHQRLYPRIFGRGNVPVHPGGGQKMRWCTWQTKVLPMREFARTVADDVVQLSGVRWGESDKRDGKLSAGGCSAGGECGLPQPGEGVYAPIITWRTCTVIEWLQTAELLPDLAPIMADVVRVYGAEVRADLFGGTSTKARRFGCIGCPAMSKDRHSRGQQAHLRRLYGVWQELYSAKNRLLRVVDGEVMKGPVKMAARQRYFAEVLEIQRDSGVGLVSAEDEAFIRDCWARKVYPRGWSEADESVQAPSDGLLTGIT